MLKEIESKRKALLSEQSPLTWERPWLKQSQELRERLDLNDNNTNFQTTITTAKATLASRSTADCKTLMAVVLSLKPSNALEMGTNVGISGGVIASAMKLSGGRKFITLEGSPAKGEVAVRNFALLGLDIAQVVVGDFADTLEPALAKLTPLNLAFIDGFHEEHATIRYHRLAKASAASGAVLIYDDIDWSAGMAAAWTRIVNDPDVATAIEIGSLGICRLK